MARHVAKTDKSTVQMECLGNTLLLFLFVFCVLFRVGALLLLSLPPFLHSMHSSLLSLRLVSLFFSSSVMVILRRVDCCFKRDSVSGRRAGGAVAIWTLYCVVSVAEWALLLLLLRE
jgi:hypothetical protein